MKKDSILDIVNEETGLDIKKKTRKREYTEARFIYYDLCKKFATDGTSLHSIGRTVKKDHATVLHGVKWCEAQLSINNKEFAYKYNSIKNLLLKKKKHFQRFGGSEEKAFERLQYAENEIRLLLEVVDDYKKKNKALNKNIQQLKSGYGWKEKATTI